MDQKRIQVSKDRTYLGKRVLVGMTYESADGEFIRQEQFHGLIVEVNEDSIVIQRNDTGQRQSLLPEIEAAPPGAYRLRATGEVVKDPDYLAKWIVQAPLTDTGGA